MSQIYVSRWNIKSDIHQELPPMISPRGWNGSWSSTVHPLQHSAFWCTLPLHCAVWSTFQIQCSFLQILALMPPSAAEQLANVTLMLNSLLFPHSKYKSFHCRSLCSTWALWPWLFKKKKCKGGRGDQKINFYQIYFHILFWISKSAVFDRLFQYFSLACLLFKCHQPLLTCLVVSQSCQPKTNSSSWRLSKQNANKSNHCKSEKLPAKSLQCTTQPASHSIRNFWVIHQS